MLTELRKRSYSTISIVLVVVALLNIGDVSPIITCITIVILGVIATAIGLRSKEPQKIRKKRKFKFLQKEQMDIEIRQLSLNQSTQLHIVEESFLISEVIEEIIDLIVNEFIHQWYHHISASLVFEDSVKLELKSVVITLKQKLGNVDLAKLLVSKIIPLMNRHFLDYLNAESKVKEKSINNVGSLEWDIETAREYDKGKLHPAVSLSLGCSEKEKKYLSKKIGLILPKLLSSKENTNDPAMSLVREIVACTVLSNVFGMLSEGDFYNLLIIKFIGENLKHRNQVKQLRAALEEHSQQLAHKSSVSSLREQLNQDGMDLTDKAYFKQALTEISYNKSIDDLKAREKVINAQIAKESLNSKSTIGSRRLKIMKLSVQERINKLSKANSESVSELKNLSLLDVLNNLVASKSFSEFLKNRGRLNLLLFYQTVDLIKAPLEDSTIDDEGENKLSLSLEFLDLEDVKEVYEMFFSDSKLDLDESLIETVKAYADNQDPDKKVILYQQARKALLKLQNDAYQTICEADFPIFKKSNMFLRLAQIENMGSNVVTRKESIAFPLSMQSDDQEDQTSDVSPAVFKAVEDAFSEIMKSSHTKELSPSRESETVLSTVLEASNGDLEKRIERKDLFGETSSLFGDDSQTVYSNPQRYSKLFDDVSDESGTDNDSINFDSDTQAQSVSLLDEAGDDMQVHLAAPGNLRLSEEILKLDEEIEKLADQQYILEPLLKKAELTNNVAELKILKKSKVSLDREISSKELQKQQYIVQENDNSLYGKSRVNIQSYISGSEKGKEFTMYIVEVQKFSNDDPDVVTAGWIVARRFSQFFKLHEYLKARYPLVSSLKFPKRTVLVLKFQQKQVVEMRKAALEEYLQALISIPEVCANRALRSFLSSENFNLRKNQPFDEVKTATNVRVNAESVTNKLYNGLQSRLVDMGPRSRPDKAANEDLMRNIKDMQRELRQFDEVSSSSGSEIKAPFVKPICDLLISIFSLNSSKSWLRGRALLVILQQIFGTTIERKVYEFIDLNVKSEECMLDLINNLKNTLFPNGKFKDPPVIRSLIEQASTKHEAKVLMSIFMNETCSKIFGLSNTSYASSNLFGMFQNDFLNKHLLFTLLDEILNELFPEVSL